MRKLITYTVILICILTVSVITARIVGNARPLSPEMQAIQLTECDTPCLLRIVPNAKTSDPVYQDTLRRFNMLRPELITDYASSTWWELIDLIPGDAIDENQTIFSLWYQDGTVQQVFISKSGNNEEMPTLGEVVAFMGAPSCISITDTLLVLAYQKSEAFFEVQTLGKDYLTWTKPIYSISFSTQENTRKSDCETGILSRWYGLSERMYRVKQ